MQAGKPVFCDIDPKSYNISPELIKEKINDSTKAILPVHLYGQPCNMKKIMHIAKDYNLYVIEDACQAHGAKYEEKKVGSIGDIGIFSFYPTKNMTTGEGGMLTTNDDSIAEKARIFRNHGQIKTYLHKSLGFNFRMTNIAAAIGLPQLQALEENNNQRRKNALFLSRELEGIKGIYPPFIEPEVTHVFNQYTVRIEENFSLDRDRFKEYLKGKGIGYGIYYPLPIHRQPIFKNMGYKDELVDCPVSLEMAEKVLSLPVHPSVSQKDFEYIIDSIKKIGV
jgi:perosamine synthetase